MQRVVWMVRDDEMPPSLAFARLKCCPRFRTVRRTDTVAVVLDQEQPVVMIDLVGLRLGLAKPGKCVVA